MINEKPTLLSHKTSPFDLNASQVCITYFLIFLFTDRALQLKSVRWYAPRVTRLEKFLFNLTRIIFGLVFQLG